MASNFRIKRSTDGQYHFTLEADNSQVVLSSERYKDKASALKGIASVRKHAPDAQRYGKLVSSGGQAYFVLKAANGQVVGTSQMYASEATRDAGIQACVANALSATLVDTTLASAAPAAG